MSEEEENEPPDRKAPQPTRRRFGFMKGQFKVPDDFDTMLQAEIEEMFYDSPIEPRTDDEDLTPGEPPRNP